MEWLVNNLGTVLTILSFIVVSAVTIGTIKGDVKHIDNKLTKLEDETSELKKVVVELAKQEGRIHSVEQILISQGHRVDAITMRIDKLLQREYDAER